MKSKKPLTVRVNGHIFEWGKEVYYDKYYRRRQRSYWMCKRCRYSPPEENQHSRRPPKKASVTVCSGVDIAKS